MLNAFVKVQRWWRNGHAASVRCAPYEVFCACGKTHRGYRESHHQVVRCSGCGRSLFVLPSSPFPANSHSKGSQSQRIAPDVPIRQRNPWMWPILAGGTTFIVAVIALTLILTSVLGPRQPTQTLVAATTAEVEAKWNAGRKAIDDGDLVRAAQELDEARTLLALQPSLLSTSETRKLNQLHRQAALLADWPREPLEVTLKRWEPLDPKDLKAVVDGRRGSTVIFDIETRRDAAGQYHVVSKRAVEAQRIDLQNVKLLQRLPLGEPQRVFFGARLADVQRVAGGLFAIRLEPESGVLLTDPTLVRKCLGQSLDVDLEKVLQKQSQWASDLP